MRRAAKRDVTEAAIVSYLREIGYSVAQLSGDGLPDLMVGRAGRTWLLECKSPKGSLTKAQRGFIQTWTGSPVWVVHSPGEAMEALTVLAQQLEEATSYPRGEPDPNGERAPLHAGRDMSGTGGT